MIWLAAGAIAFVLGAWATHKAKKIITTKKVKIQSPVVTEEREVGNKNDRNKA